MRFLFFLSTLLFTFSLFAQEPKYQALVLDKTLTENANAIVRLDEMDVHLKSHKAMNYTVRQVVTVLNKSGQQGARTAVGYDKETKIKGIEAIVYDKLGKKIEHFRRKDFKDFSAADGFSLYRDDRILLHSYTPIQYPYTIEFIYEVETSDTGVFPPRYFLSDYSISLEKSSYKISYTSESLKPVIKEFNLAGIGVEKSEDIGQITYTTSNIPAIEEESLSPNDNDILPHLSVRIPNFHYKGHDATVNDWKQLGKWIDDKLLKGRTELPEATKNKAKELIEESMDDLEKAKIIYKYVQDNTRYISVQIGVGGLQPIAAVDVDRVKYGDCKGLSNYTKALLEAVDVDAYYTVIQAGSQKEDFDQDFADLRQGNHVILAIPYQDTYYWVDCTSQTHPFGFVGDFTDDRQALVVTPDGGEIVKTVAYLNEQNYQKTLADYELFADGSISVDIDIITKGVQYDNRYFLEKQTKDDILEYYKEYWSNINNLNVRRYTFENDKDNVAFNEKVIFDAINYASRSGDRILFAINALNKNTFVPNRYRNRKQAFEIQRGFFDEDEYKVKIPEGYSIEALPDSLILETEFGTYSRSLEFNSQANFITYKRSLLIKQGYYPKEKYKLYRDFRKKVAAADKAQAALLKTKP